MSLTFSRRSFLKYTAVAAVAVAGSSLLTGCKDNPYQPTGTIGSTLTIMGDFTLKNATLDATTNKMTCAMTFKCTSKRNLHVVPTCFQIDVTSKDGKKVTTYNCDQGVNNKVSLKESKKDLAKDETLTTELYVEQMNALEDGCKVEIKYWPRAQSSEGLLGYTEAYATWTMKYNATKVAFEKV